MRITRVQKAQKDQGDCGSCGKPIPAGTGYKWIKPRYQGKRKRHLTCPDWRQSEMTQGKMSGVYAAQEGFEDAAPFDSREELEAALEAAADEIQQVAEEYRESASNMEEYFQGSYQVDELNEKADQLEQWADEIRDAGSNVQDPTEEYPAADDMDGVVAFLEQTSEAEEFLTRINEGENFSSVFEEWVEQYGEEPDFTEAEDVVQNCPV